MKGQKTASPDYKPTVTVSTSQFNGNTEIRVSDNGTGIPDFGESQNLPALFHHQAHRRRNGLRLVIEL